MNMRELYRALQSKDAGISYPALGSYKSFNSVPSFDRARMILDIFGYNISDEELLVLLKGGESDSLLFYEADRVRRENYGDRLQVECSIECDDFLIPALSVQPLVENAVRHGIGTYEQGGTVYIKAFKKNEKICIEIIDDGSGQSSITEQQKKRRGIGIENVRSRLRTIDIGELEIIRSEHGTTARITIEKGQEDPE